jgi:uncharacterized protein YeaO (DUF488 family)
MTLKIKSLKETTEKSDGLRILIARYRPRAPPKSKENWNEWWKDLAPSIEAHQISKEIFLHRVSQQWHNLGFLYNYIDSKCFRCLINCISINSL